LGWHPNLHPKIYGVASQSASQNEFNQWGIHSGPYQ
jgi:hypothetical protein